MPVAVRPLAELDSVRELFVTLSDNPILALLAGILVTGIIQSSSVSIGILQSMAMTGMIPWSAAVFIVLGQNVGTCFTTMLTSIGANKNTRAASFVHFVYNAAGAVIFSVAAVVFFSFVNPALGDMSASSTNISMIHTGYNMLLLLLLFPLGTVILQVSMKMAGAEKIETVDKSTLPELDESILETPEYALENSAKAVHKLAGLIRTNIVTASNIFTDRKFSDIDDFNVLAAETDKTNTTIKSFITKLYNERLSDNENVAVAALLHILTSLERINGHTKGVVGRAAELREINQTYSESAILMLRDINTKTILCFDETIRALTTNGFQHAELAVQSAEDIQALREDYKVVYRERIASGTHNVQRGIVFIETVRHMARIAHNLKSIAETVTSEEKSVVLNSEV
jgi:phosphate:Na+ symporter